ncbi:peptidoglycan binding-like protein [Gottschalkia purinilytica]|uniref:Peptidoglycan binding-like protein n=1 Tax=Gottschalkia purinilytica TaxID=1503 RepID=A0A0L0WDA9_GOTPU|nr:peptidoglycan-binding domain-containing protein [Gottschalkia purinilytica]KNF09420.1 peptidoglycan binding-like protein [Gottschalkia purinilytica]
MKKTLGILALSVIISSTSPVYAQDTIKESDDNATTNIIESVDGSKLRAAPLSDGNISAYSYGPLSSIVQKYYRGEPLLVRGSQGYYVQRLQHAINNRGYRNYGKWVEVHIAEDGIYGPATENGVRVFQQHFKEQFWADLKVDGKAGEQVWSIINFFDW